MRTSSSLCSKDTRSSTGSAISGLGRQSGTTGSEITHTGLVNEEEAVAQGEHRSGSDALTKVEAILAQLGTLRRPGNHFREISLGQGRLLAVDVFQSGREQGHVRVHLHGTIPPNATISPSTSPPPQVPSGTMQGCSACVRAPGGLYPARYTGPRGTRKYFGFQWHTGAVDLAAIEAAARWLAKGSAAIA